MLEVEYKVCNIGFGILNRISLIHTLLSASHPDLKYQSAPNVPDDDVCAQLDFPAIKKL